MHYKQSYLYAIIGAIIGLGVIFIVHNQQSETLSANNYNQDLKQMTAKLDSLTNTVNTLTKLTLKLDRSFKEEKLNKKLLASKQVPAKPEGTAANADKQHTNDTLVSDQSNTQTTNSNTDNLVVSNEWRIKQQEVELVSSFENHFSQQNTDSIWANNAEQAIQKALNTDAFINSQLKSISCRATLCKIDTDHRDLDSELVFLQQINSKAGFSDTESFYTRDEQPGGNIVMTLYLSRDGHRLPRFDLVNENIAG